MVYHRLHSSSSCVCHAFASALLCLVVTCWERADKLFMMLNCVFVTFPCDILGQVWYLIVSIPDLCHLSYFVCGMSDRIFYIGKKGGKVKNLIWVHHPIKCAVIPNSSIYPNDISKYYYMILFNYLTEHYVVPTDHIQKRYSSLPYVSSIWFRSTCFYVTW